jgi:hypothetical protein
MDEGIEIMECHHKNWCLVLVRRFDLHLDGEGFDSIEGGG